MKFRLLLLMALILFPALLLAAGQAEPLTYVIKPGDTLWGLSERFIKDPKYWPNLWAENAQITNPNFIYPGQKVRIYPGHQEVIPKDGGGISQKDTHPVTGKAGVKTSSSVPAFETHRPGSAVEKSYTLYGSEGFLAEKSFRPYGTVIGSQHDRIVLGVDDIVYTDIGSSLNASGDKFSIFAKDMVINHPRSNEEMGHKMIPLGALQLTDVEQKSSRAIITKSFREISPGAYLMPYKESRRREIPLKYATRELKGYIIDSDSGTSIIGAGEIVYVDLGSSQGAEAGNMLYIVRDVKIDQRYVEGRIDQVPQELLGAVVILETGKKTSIALVVKSVETIYKGDRLVSQTK